MNYESSKTSSIGLSGSWEQTMDGSEQKINPYILDVGMCLLMGDLTILHTDFEGIGTSRCSGLVVARNGTGIRRSGDLADVLLVDFIQKYPCFRLHSGVEGLSLGLSCGARHPIYWFLSQYRLQVWWAQSIAGTGKLAGICDEAYRGLIGDEPN